MGRTIISRKDLNQSKYGNAVGAERINSKNDPIMYREKRSNDGQLQAKEKKQEYINKEVESHRGEQISSENIQSVLGIEQAMEPDKYTSRLLKYIPAEIIALYLTFDAIIRSVQHIQLYIYWIIFGFCLIGTYLYLWRIEKVKKQTQLVLSVVAYCVWVFALGGPFIYLSWYNPVYGGLLLPAYTFIVAIIEA